ncbi:DNA-directed RNA polymerase subunit N (RpoN/RPB10) [Paraburkholderia youngii]
MCIPVRCWHCRERRTQDDLVAFMERVAAAHPGKQVHVIWDNLNTHRAQAVWQAFNERHDQRFHFHFTPLHASIIRQRGPSNGLSGAKHYATELQRQLRSLLGHEQIVTPAYGRHLLIKRLDDEEPTVVARLTELARNRYSAAFRSHTGRWEPLPGTGSLDEMVEVVVTLLQPYLQPDNY